MVEERKPSVLVFMLLLALAFVFPPLGAVFGIAGARRAIRARNRDSARRYGAITVVAVATIAGDVATIIVGYGLGATIYAELGGLVVFLGWLGITRSWEPDNTPSGAAVHLHGRM